MASFTVNVRGGDEEIHELCAWLGVSMRNFVEKVTGERCPMTYVHPNTVDREWVRSKLFDLLTYQKWTKPFEGRDPVGVRREVIEKYAVSVSAFIDENVDLIARIRLYGAGRKAK